MHAQEHKAEGHLTSQARITHLSGVSVIEARDRVVRALGEEGFGLLAEIDLGGTLTRRLDKHFAPYFILEVCHPKLAERALAVSSDAGLLLPCKVCVWQHGPEIAVSFLSPKQLVAAIGLEGLGAVAADAEAHLDRALARAAVTEPS